MTKKMQRLGRYLFVDSGLYCAWHLESWASGLLHSVGVWAMRTVLELLQRAYNIVEIRHKYQRFHS
jgi:hypothetical protein